MKQEPEDPKSLGPIEVGKLTKRHWNALNEPIVSDLKKRVSRKTKKARVKSAGPPAKIPKLNPPAPAVTQEVAQTPQVEAVGMDVVAVGPSTAHPSAGPGGATGESSQPTPVIQPLLPTPNPPAQGNQNQGADANWYSGNPPPGSRGFLGGRRRPRYRGRGGRNRSSFPRGPRWGGNAQPRHPSSANVSSGGNGGYQGNNRRQWDSARCVNCGLQYASWVKTCSLCNSAVC